MIGVVLVLLALGVVGPVGLFAVGAIWSAITGWLMSEDADRRSTEDEAQPSAS